MGQNKPLAQYNILCFHGAARHNCTKDTTYIKPEQSEEWLLSYIDIIGGNKGSSWNSCLDEWNPYLTCWMWKNPGIKSTQTLEHYVTLSNCVSAFVLTERPITELSNSPPSFAVLPVLSHSSNDSHQTTGVIHRLQMSRERPGRIQPPADRW